MLEQRKVLIVDDDKNSRLLLAELLKDQYFIVLAKSGQMALDMAKKHLPDAILLDVVMPDMDGFQVLNSLKGADSTRNIPVVLITGLDSVDIEEKGLDCGASDYINKPFNESIVRLRIRNQVQAAHQRRLLENLALIDPLTEIPNRRRLEQALTTEIAQVDTMSAVMIDVDFFKDYNDRYGHSAGDRVLKKIAATLASFVADNDGLVARYGGEEFTLLLPNVDRNTAMTLAESVRQAILQLAIPHQYSSSSGNVSVSMGGFTFSADKANSMTAHQVIKAADDMLYQAKAAGRNQVIWG